MFPWSCAQVAPAHVLPCLAYTKYTVYFFGVRKSLFLIKLNVLLIKGSFCVGINVAGKKVAGLIRQGSGDLVRSSLRAWSLTQSPVRAHLRGRLIFQRLAASSVDD